MDDFDSVRVTHSSHTLCAEKKTLCAEKKCTKCSDIQKIFWAQGVYNLVHTEHPENFLDTAMKTHDFAESDWKRTND